MSPDEAKGRNRKVATLPRADYDGKTGRHHLSPCRNAGVFYLRYAAHRTHYLGSFGQRADIALPSHCQPVAGFFIFRLREPSSTSLLVKSSRGPDLINQHQAGANMKKTTMQDRPDTWAVMLAWLVNHKNEAGYSVLAFVMSILATSRGAKSKWKDRIAGATMCGILCFFAQPTLTAIWAIFNWNFPPELCWPISAGVGYVGVDSLFAYARRRLGLNEPGDKANADPQ